MADRSGPGDTHAFAATLVKQLAEAQSRDGRLRDPVDGTPVSSSEYAQTCFATAAVRIASISNDDSLRDAAVAALERYLSEGKTAHDSTEFDLFAIHELRESEPDFPEELLERVEDRIDFCANARSVHGNNWLLLQALDRVRRGNLRDRLVVRRTLELSNHWEGPDGLLADQPRRPRKTRETPLVYHAKMAMCLVRLAARGVDVGDRADRALVTLARLTRPDGEFGYFGRSENTLFGYATALDAVIRRRQMIPSPPDWLGDLRDRLLSFLGSHFDPQAVNVQPTTSRQYEPIDGYVKRTVYGAYAAMILLGLPRRQLPEREPNGTQWPSVNDSGPTFGKKIDRPPFRHIQSGAFSVTISTTGQIKWANDAPDPRYAGGVPVAMTVEGSRITAGVPIDYLSHPAPPFLPCIDTTDGSFAPVTWQPVETSETDIVLTGQFHEYTVPSGQSETVETEHDQTEGKTTPGTVSMPRRLLRRAVSRTVVERVVTDRRKRQTKLPVGVTRSIRTHPACDFLVVIDRFETVAARESNPPAIQSITPAPAVVRTPFADAVVSVTSDSETDDFVRKHARSHWGDATWVKSESRQFEERFSTALLLDPGNEVEAAMVHERPDGRTTITVRTGNNTFEFDCPPP